MVPNENRPQRLHQLRSGLRRHRPRGRGAAARRRARHGTPAELNDLLVAGELDVSVISAIEYARHGKELLLLPDLAISCDGPVRSVALFSKKPVSDLGSRTVLLSASSRTSVALLELLCHAVWHIRSE